MSRYISKGVAELYGKKVLGTNLYEKNWQVHDVLSRSDGFISTITQEDVQERLLSSFGIHIQPEPYWCEDGMKWLVKIFKIVKKDGRLALLRTFLPYENRGDAIEAALEFVLSFVIMTREEARKIALDNLQEELEKNGPEAIFCASPQPGKNSWTIGEAIESVEKDLPLENGSSIIDDVLLFHEYQLSTSNNNYNE